MMPRPKQTETHWKAAIVHWVLEQGVSTVLLIVNIATIIWFLKYQAPAYINQIQSGYDRIAKVHSESIAELVRDSKEDRATDREVFLNMVRELRPQVQSTR